MYYTRASIFSHQDVNWDVNCEPGIELKEAVTNAFNTTRVYEQSIGSRSLLGICTMHFHEQLLHPQ